MMAGEEEGVWEKEADDVTAAATPPSIIPPLSYSFIYPRHVNSADSGPATAMAN